MGRCVGGTALGMGFASSVGLFLFDAFMLSSSGDEATQPCVETTLVTSIHSLTGVFAVHRSTESMGDLRMGAVLRTLSLWSPFAGAAAAVIVFLHALIIIKSGLSYELDEGNSANARGVTIDNEKHPWRVSVWQVRFLSSSSCRGLTQL